MDKWLKTCLFVVFFFGVLSSPLFACAILVLPDGALIKGAFTPEVYFMENGLKRWVINEAVFRNFDFEWSKIKIVLNEELEGYPVGKILDEKSKYPDGTLLRGDHARAGDGVKVYAMQKGSARWVATEQDFENLGFDWQSVMDISPAKLKGLPKGSTLSQPERILRPLTILKETSEPVLETTEAVFRFSGVAGSEDKRNLKFETFIEGVDSNWIATASQERKINLPPKAGQYKFFVRAVAPNGSSVDRLPRSFAFEAKFSPYYGQVTMSGSGLTSTDANKEKLTLASKSAEPIYLRGWSVGSEKYKTSFLLPDSAFEIPDQPYYQYENELFITSKRKIIIFSGASPMGVNFRLNKCVGYLDAYYKFDPVLPNLCVKPTAAEMDGLNAYCKKVIGSSVASCKEPDLNDVMIDAECRDFMKERLSYSKCVENNNAFYDFLLDEWRVYLRRSAEIWPNEKDAILLRDQDGLLVARMKY